MSRHSQAWRALGVIGAVAALSSACTVGPDYERPALTPPAAIRGGESAPSGPSLHAASRVLQAQAVLGITKADAYPAVDGAVDAGGDPAASGLHRAVDRRVAVGAGDA